MKLDNLLHCIITISPVLPLSFSGKSPSRTRSQPCGVLIASEDTFIGEKFRIFFPTSFFCKQATQVSYLFLSQLLSIDCLILISKVGALFLAREICNTVGTIRKGNYTVITSDWLWQYFRITAHFHQQKKLLSESGAPLMHTYKEGTQSAVSFLQHQSHSKGNTTPDFKFS